MTIDSQDQLEKLKKIGTIVADCLKYMLGKVEEGMTTKELDELGGQFLERHGARSAPKVTYNFPGFTCISLNHEAAHGIPSAKRIIKAGDLINIDVSAELDGYYGDTGASMCFKSQNPELKRMCQSTKKALQDAIKSVSAPAPLNGIGKAIERVAKKDGFTVVRNLCSHGVGASLHEDPQQILGYFDPHDRRVIHNGMVFTIEPFLSNGSKHVKELSDGWTLAHPGKFMSAQFEHTMVATKRGALILTNPSKGAPFVP